MKARVLVIDGCFANLELIALARMGFVGTNHNFVIFDDMQEELALSDVPTNKKGPKGPRNRWGQMK